MVGHWHTAGLLLLWTGSAYQTEMRAMRLIALLLLPQWLLMAQALATTRLPDFADYPATGKHRGKMVKLDAGSHPYARRFRSVLTGALEHGPNFAGHYVLARWGCGTSCEALAMVDTNSGRVMVPKAIESITHDLPCDKPLVEFERESALLKLTQRDGEAAVTRYLVWGLAGHPGQFREILTTRTPIQAFCR